MTAVNSTDSADRSFPRAASPIPGASKIRSPASPSTAPPSKQTRFPSSLSAALLLLRETRPFDTEFDRADLELLDADLG
ncbi:hypothetical protein [Microcoleus sp. N9_B4]|uniref:hypothetical protein n=1 Tax=Microcoleus sp. N9_B4 TaxID=3055386 RepID=UPI004040C91E